MLIEAIDFKVFYLKKNVGHGGARRKSLRECSNNLVALMDSDDISKPNRFEIQLKRFINNPHLSIVGGQISEFVNNPENVTGIRKVPERHDEIKKYTKKRCPMNQVSVMFRKDDVEKSGGYRDWYCEEDYYLWIRMMKYGCAFENVPHVLVNVRTGEGMTSRRGGWRYFKSEAKLQRYMLDTHVIGLLRYIYNITVRFVGEVVVSNNMRQKLFRYMRTKKEPTMESDNSLYKDIIKKWDGLDDIEYPHFSVSMCVYGGDNAEWFDVALDSVINQTVKPSEIVLVVDGPIPNTIQNVINKYADICQGV